MEMEEEMEVEFMVFEAREVDLDYEFDAAMYFDFTLQESIAEAREAERWFDTALSYPPSRESQSPDFFIFGFYLIDYQQSSSLIF